MNSNSLKIKLSHFEIMCSGKALGTLLGLIRDLTGTSPSPKKERRLLCGSPPRFLPSSSSLFLFLLQPLFPPLAFLYQDARETFCGNVGVTAAAGAAGCIFFTILFMILISPR